MLPQNPKTPKPQNPVMYSARVYLYRFVLASSVHVERFKIVHKVGLLAEGIFAAFLDFGGFLSGCFLLLATIDLALLHFDFECTHLILVGLLLFRFLGLVNLLSHVLVNHATAVELGVHLRRRQSIWSSSGNRLLLSMRLNTGIHLS